MRNVLIAGAGGRDFHTFATVFRDDPDNRVVAFTAAQIPHIDRRTYPPELAGPRYPQGIPIRPEAELLDLIRTEAVDEVVLAYSDLAYSDVMHLASEVVAAGADFRMMGTRATTLSSTKPVIAVCATRTGCGKSQTSRALARVLQAQGHEVVLIRHPMPYGDLRAMRVQRFASLADIDASRPTIEEREEYERAVRDGIVVFAGVDYTAILRAAEQEADVIIWDGGNNDLPFVRPDLMIVLTDALRPGSEQNSYPGEANLLLADVVIVNKVDSASAEDVAKVVCAVEDINPSAHILRADSPVTLDDGPSLVGRRVLVVEDGPTLTHGGMAFGAGIVAARDARARIVDPRPYVTGELRDLFARFPHLGPVLPAMGYDERQLDELAAAITATPCDAVIAGTPIDLAAALAGRLPIDRNSNGSARPIRSVTYDLDARTVARLGRLVADRLPSRSGAGAR